MIKRPRITATGPADSKFEDLMCSRFDALYSRAFALTGNTQDAEDLLQELCIRVFTHQDEIVELESPAAWMWRVLYRLFVDLVRSRKRSPIRLLSGNDASNVLAETVASEAPDPERQVDASIMDGRLRAAWAKLSADEQLLLSLQGIEGLSLAEIHELTGLPIGTIKSRLHRSRARLGRLLAREERKLVNDIQDSSHELQRHRKSAG
jgi:RNA polymerase sigma-70 factor (ECF subfamily)